MSSRAEMRSFHPNENKPFNRCKEKINFGRQLTVYQRTKAPKKAVVEDPQTKSYDRALSERMFSILGRKVTVNKGRKHTLEITYTDGDDLEALIKRICGDDVFDF